MPSTFESNKQYRSCQSSFVLLLNLNCQFCYSFFFALPRHRENFIASKAKASSMKDITEFIKREKKNLFSLNMKMKRNTRQNKRFENLILAKDQANHAFENIFCFWYFFSILIVFALQTLISMLARRIQTPAHCMCLHTMFTCVRFL